MEIERAWGREPGWWSGLERERQIRLLAWQRRHLELTTAAPAPPSPPKGRP